MKLPRVYTAEGVILKRKAIGEADRMLTVFTRQYGKIRVIAKGVRRITSRRAGHIEVFSRVILTLHAHPPWDVVSEAQAISRGTLFESDVARMTFAYCMCELVDQLLADRQEHADVFLLLTSHLDALKEANSREVWQGTLTDFVHNLLWILGFLPREQFLNENHIAPYVEGITERRLRTWPIMSGILSV